MPFIFARREGSDTRLCHKVENPSRLGSRSVLHEPFRNWRAPTRHTWYDMGPSPRSELCVGGLPDWASPKAHSDMGPRFLALSSVAIVVLVACGGSSPGDLFASDASAEASTVLSDGGTSLAADGATVNTKDGAAPSITTLACGPSACTLPGETCCVARTNGTFSFSCVTGGCPSTGGGNRPTALKCASSANCPGGTVCCVVQANNQTVSSCKTSCGNNDAQLCDPTASPTECTANAPCSTNKIGDWDLPSPFATCGGKGG